MISTCLRHSRARSEVIGCSPSRLIHGGRCRIASSANSVTRAAMTVAASSM
jgi:hypothetical protein